MTTTTAFSVPGLVPRAGGTSGSRGWRSTPTRPRTRDDEDVLTFRDPDGMVDRPGRLRRRPPLRLGRRRRHPGRPRGPRPARQSRCPSGCSTRRPTMLTDLLGMTPSTGEGADRARFGMADGALRCARRRARRRPRPRPAGRRHRAPRRLPRAGPGDHDRLAAGAARRAASRSRRSSTGSTSSRSTSASPAGCCSRSPPTRPGFAVDEPLLELGRHLQAAAVAGAGPGADRRGAAAAAARRGVTTVTERTRAGWTGRTSSCRRRPSAGGPPLLLLHGTGGDEHDLLPLRDLLSPGAAVLSVARDRAGERDAPVLPAAARGRVRRGRPASAGRRPRRRSWTTAGTAYGIDPGALVAVGFSNGANIASALLLRRPGPAARRPCCCRRMVPFADPPTADLDRHARGRVERAARPDDPGRAHRTARRPAPGARRRGGRAAAPGRAFDRAVAPAPDQLLDLSA